MSHFDCASLTRHEKEDANCSPSKFRSDHFHLLPVFLDEVVSGLRSHRRYFEYSYLKFVENLRQ